MQTLMRSIGHFGPEQPPAAWITLFDQIADHERLYRVLLGGKGRSWFAIKMQTCLVDLIDGHISASVKKFIADQLAFEDGFLPYLTASLIVDTLV